MKFYKINGDEEDIIGDYEIGGFPSFLIIKKGEVLGKKVGRLSKEELDEFVYSFSK